MGYMTEPLPPEADGYRRLMAGDPAPWFEQTTSGGPRLRLDLTAGRYLLLCFFMGTQDADAQRALDFVAQNRSLFDDENLSFFGVSIDWRDQYEHRTAPALPGIRFFWDFDLKVSRLYGVVPANATVGAISVRRCWFVLDRALRLVAVIRFQKNGSERSRLLDLLRGIREREAGAGVEVPPPLLHVPDVFEPEFCRRLIAAFKAVPEAVGNAGGKRRIDQVIEDDDLVTEIGVRIQRRIVPEMRKAFGFRATKTDRHVVALYGEGAALPSQRDDASLPGPRFALSVSLSEDYEGGEICFPEYGRHRYRSPLGTALLFSSSILHRVSPVVRGQSYTSLSSLYGEATDLTQEGLSRERVAPQDQVTPPPILEEVTGEVTPLPTAAADRVASLPITIAASR